MFDAEASGVWKRGKYEPCRGTCGVCSSSTNSRVQFFHTCSHVRRVQTNARRSGWSSLVHQTPPILFLFFLSTVFKDTNKLTDILLVVKQEVALEALRDAQSERPCPSEEGRRRDRGRACEWGAVFCSRTSCLTFLFFMVHRSFAHRTPSPMSCLPVPPDLPAHV